MYNIYHYNYATREQGLHVKGHTTAQIDDCAPTRDVAPSQTETDPSPSNIYTSAVSYTGIGYILKILFDHVVSDHARNSLQQAQNSDKADEQLSL